MALFGMGWEEIECDVMDADSKQAKNVLTFFKADNLKKQLIHIDNTARTGTEIRGVMRYYTYLRYKITYKGDLLHATIQMAARRLVGLEAEKKAIKYRWDPQAYVNNTGRSDGSFEVYESKVTIDLEKNILQREEFKEIHAEKHQAPGYEVVGAPGYQRMQQKR